MWPQAPSTSRSNMPSNSVEHLPTSSNLHHAPHHTATALSPRHSSICIHSWTAKMKHTSLQAPAADVIWHLAQASHNSVGNNRTEQIGGENAHHKRRAWRLCWQHTNTDQRLTRRLITRRVSQEHYYSASAALLLSTTFSCLR
jgi:hypothetical protein